MGNTQTENLNQRVTFSVFLKRDEISTGWWGFRTPDDWLSSAWDMNHFTLYFCANSGNVNNFTVDEYNTATKSLSGAGLLKFQTRDITSSETFCGVFLGTISDTKTQIKTVAHGYPGLDRLYCILANDCQSFANYVLKNLNFTSNSKEYVVAITVTQHSFTIDRSDSNICKNTKLYQPTIIASQTRNVAEMIFAISKGF
eukprot:TRINITY_DN10840_c0_g1_i1.p1 TRINITY_DN10840_c0_g1~~TRINITY_DN10840_c0_g1_i1.p1  ORF type:complete len:199 (+),score=21.32 TRINITY_DN10840_c0_g1_i1:189-785(+)